MKPDYPTPRGLLKGRTVVITAAAALRMRARRS